MCLGSGSEQQLKKLFQSSKSDPSGFENRVFLKDCCSKAHFPSSSNKSQKWNSQTSFWGDSGLKNPAEIEKVGSKFAMKNIIKICKFCIRFLLHSGPPGDPSKSSKIFSVFGASGRSWLQKGRQTPPRQPKGSDFKGLGIILDSILKIFLGFVNEIFIQILNHEPTFKVNVVVSSFGAVAAWRAQRTG